MRKQTGWIALGMTGVDSEDDYYFADLVIHSSGNLGGHFRGDDKDEQSGTVTKNINVADGRWHHVAFTSYANTHRLFLDGEIVRQQRVGYMSFIGDRTVLGVVGQADKKVSNVLVDDLAFFEIGLGTYAIKGLMKDGIDTFLETMPVEPADKVATTWAAVKNRR